MIVALIARPGPIKAAIKVRAPARKWVNLQRIFIDLLPVRYIFTKDIASPRRHDAEADGTFIYKYEREAADYAGEGRDVVG